MSSVNIDEQMDDSNIENSIEELEHLRKLFIGGLHPSTTSETLQQYFGKFGKVLEARVMKDQNGKTRGFGFITYARSHMVDEAQKARPHKIDGKVVESKRLVPRTDINKPESRVTVKKLFVGAIKNEHDEACLRKYFGKFGNVVAMNIAVDPNTGRRRGFAFVEYDDYDSVDRVVLQKLHCVKGVLLDVKKALTKQMSERLNQGMLNYGSPNFNGPLPNMPPNNMPPNNMPPNNMPPNMPRTNVPPNNMQPNNLPANNMPPNNNPPTNSGPPNSNLQPWNNGYYGNSGNTWDANGDNTGSQVSNWNNGQNPGWNPSVAGGADNWGNNTSQYPQQTSYSGSRRNYSSSRVNPYPDTKNINVKHTANRGTAANVNNRNPITNNNDTWQYNQAGNTGNWSNQNVPANATWNNNPTGPSQGPPMSAGYPPDGYANPMPSGPNANHRRN